MSYKVGDQVEAKDGIKGTIVYIEDGIAYLELTNNAEMEFKVSDLVDVGTYHRKLQEEMDKKYSSNSPNPAINEETASAIIEKLGTLMNIAEATHNNINRMMGNSLTWSEATNVQKLNMIAVMFGRRAIDFVDAYNNNMLSRLHLVLLMELGEQLTEK